LYSAKSARGVVLFFMVMPFYQISPGHCNPKFAFFAKVLLRIRPDPGRCASQTLLRVLAAASTARSGKPTANAVTGKPAGKHAEAINKAFTQINGGGVQPAGKPTGGKKKGEKVSPTPRPQ
jgi:hypothetical protein